MRVLSSSCPSALLSFSKPINKVTEIQSIARHLPQRTLPLMLRQPFRALRFSLKIPNQGKAVAHPGQLSKNRTCNLVATCNASCLLRKGIVADYCSIEKSLTVNTKEPLNYS